MLNQLRCSGTFEAVQLISASYPTRIPYYDIHGRYKDHMPDFVQALDPPFFTEMIALACDVDDDDYQLGKSKIFFRPGKGAFLEELANMDMSEVVPMLVEKIKEYERKKKARQTVEKYLARYVAMALYAKRRQAASRIAAASKIKKAKKEAAAKKLEQAKKIEEERQKAEAEKRRKEDEERAKKAAEEKAKLEAAAAAASADEKAKLEAELKAKDDAAKAEAEKLKKSARRPTPRRGRRWRRRRRR